VSHDLMLARNPMNSKRLQGALGYSQVFSTHVLWILARFWDSVRDHRNSSISRVSETRFELQNSKIPGIYYEIRPRFTEFRPFRVLLKFFPNPIPKPWILARRRLARAAITVPELTSPPYLISDLNAGCRSPGLSQDPDDVGMLLPARAPSPTPPATCASSFTNVVGLTRS
jgi:hypothetical protein